MIQPDKLRTSPLLFLSVLFSTVGASPAGAVLLEPCRVCPGTAACWPAAQPGQSLHQHPGKAEAALGFSGAKLREICGHLQTQELMFNPLTLE